MLVRVSIPGERGFRLRLPTRLALNGLTASAAAGMARKAAGEKGSLPPFTAAQYRRLFRELLRFKHRHPNWELVHVEAADGTQVVVRL